MKEDILEQLVDDYLQNNGYFTMHNVKFKPTKEAIGYLAKKDSAFSDIDVIGINPHHRGPNRVWVVNCKSWQSGVNLTHWISGIEEDKVLNGKNAWKTFRELADTKWANAFIDKIEKLTGTRSFTYVTAVTKLIGDKSKWVEHEKFRKNLDGNPIKILTVTEILDYMNKETAKTVAPSDVGRLLQVIKASEWMKSKD
ncbi:MAG: nuclease-related domain-containing protein [Terracidiphilus sp.]